MRCDDLWRTLVRHARERGGRPAVEDGRGACIEYGGLLPAVADAAARVAAREPRSVGLLADNGPSWVLVQLAALACRVTLVPLPGFFTGDQLRHVAGSAGVDLVLTDRPERLAEDVGAMPTGGLVAGLHELRLPPGRPVPGWPGTRPARVTFTSGSTGEPRGVLLRSRALLTVADSLVEATALGPRDTHVAVLPLSLLLEEVGGVLRGLLAGARVVLPPLGDVGLAGSSSLDVERLAHTLERHAATSTILVPEMLASLVELGRAAPDRVSRTLRFAGVGGARVPVRLLEEAGALGLRVFEGYGLTEAASVVSLNTPDARRTGSAGRPLRHVRIARGEDGEILVGGSTLTAHLGDPEPRAADDLYATGDLGGLDADGYLHVLGRKRELLVTSFGRNVSPEWVESELLGHPAVAQAAVVGEGLPSLVAVLVAHPGRAAGLAGAVQAANARLPDYARVGAFVVADEPFRRDNGLLTRGGTPARAAIAVRHVAPRQPVPAAVPSTTGQGVPRTG